MLIQRFINTLPNRKDRNIEDFDVGQMNFDRKRTEEGKINKTCVSSQNRRNKKRRGRHGRRLSAILFPTFSQRAVACGPDGQRSP